MNLKLRFEKELTWIKQYKKIVNTKPRGKYIVIAGTPYHGNLGDHAIALAEYRFLEEHFPGLGIVEIPSDYISLRPWYFKFLVGRRTILIQGGGFLGTLWPNEDEMVNKVISTYKRNKIIILPQTVYYSTDEYGTKCMENSKKIYALHNNLTICAREKVSYNIAKKLFDCKIELIPDMAILLQKKEKVLTRNQVTVCLRNDKEKNLQKNEEELLKKVLLKFFTQEEIVITDTIVDHDIYINQRDEEVYNKINEFAESKLIITDRLHGMVFAAIAGVPCIVFGNCNQKVRGIYEWIKNNKYIFFLEDFVNVELAIERALSMSDCHYNNSNTLSEFDKLVKLIQT